MTVQSWLAFVPIALMYSIIPGLAFVSVLSAALRYGRRAALLTVAGIVIADVLYAGLAMSSLSFVLGTFPIAIKYVEALGVVYLFCVGMQCFVRRGEDSLPTAAAVDYRRALLIGLVVQLSNPKVMLFLAAIAPRYVDMSMVAVPQLTIIGLTFVASEAVIYCMVATVAMQLRRALSTRRAARFTRLTSGVIMIAAATHVALDLFSA
jgi:homoserine/homoserine lactone efflux protein